MTKNNLRVNLVLSTITLVITTGLTFAGSQPTFSLFPQSSPILQVPANATATLQYQVTNNSKNTRTISMVPISGINQLTTGSGVCGSPFVLAPGKSCLLSLQLSGSQLPPRISDGPIVCKTKSSSDNRPDPQLCSRPPQEKILNITGLPALNRNEVTVGNTTIGGTITPLSYNTTNNGYNWSPPVLPPLPAGATTGELLGTSCDNSGLLCTAVGSGMIAGINAPVSYLTTDGGSSWINSMASPVPPPNNTGAELFAVACSGSGLSCTAVGYYFDGVGDTHNLAFTTHDGGSSWSSFILPGAPANSDGNTLNAIACDLSGVICIAAGSALSTVTGDTINYSATTRDNGSTWNLVTLPLTASMISNANVGGIACDSTGLVCAIAGFTTTPAPFTVLNPLVFTTTDGGNSWSNAIFPTLPAGAATGALTAISCNDRGLLCTAVGRAIFSGNENPLAYTSKDGGNTWSSAILPSFPVGGVNGRLSGVSCDNSGLICTAVGRYTNAGVRRLLSYTTTDGGNTWSNPIFPEIPAGGTANTLSSVAGSR
jgi:photosystem II stability/assembly factor-like uncharacterized protein